MQKNRVTNTVGIAQDPYSYEKIFRGQCNGNRFSLIHRGKYNAGTEEMDITLDVMWEMDLDLARAKKMEEGIKKIYRKRLVGGTS